MARAKSRPKSRPTSRVVGIDHISIRVSDYEKSKAFYGKLFEFLGFEISDEYPEHDRLDQRQDPLLDRAGRGPQELPHRRRRPAPLRLRAAQPEDVDALQAFLEGDGVRIVDPADEYYEDYYAVFFLDPDGIKLEGMKYGELTAKRKRKSLKKKG